MDKEFKIHIMLIDPDTGELLGQETRYFRNARYGFKVCSAREWADEILRRLRYFSLPVNWRELVTIDLSGT
jgi:hypothetical protein